MRSLREQEELAKRLMELLLKLLRLQMTGSSDEDVRRLMLRIIELVEEIEELAREQKGSWSGLEHHHHHH
uniref:F4132-2 Chain B n=1 Tax=synthetic construct TaxID=32630 RepID=UPI0029529628|nr:Chain B, F4132-2 Chain B [synthetic construct]